MIDLLIQVWFIICLRMKVTVSADTYLAIPQCHLCKDQHVGSCKLHKHWQLSAVVLI